MKKEDADKNDVMDVRFVLLVGCEVCRSGGSTHEVVRMLNMVEKGVFNDIYSVTVILGVFGVEISY